MRGVTSWSIIGIPMGSGRLIRERLVGALQGGATSEGSVEGSHDGLVADLDRLTARLPRLQAEDLQDGERHRRVHRQDLRVSISKSLSGRMF